MLTTATKLLGGRTHDTRFLFIGSPGRGDAPLQDALQKRGLLDRAVFVDVAGPYETQQALCAADVVVVIGDEDGWAIPHRALEAMACGRPTIIAANDGACRDHIVPDQHAKLVPADAPERIADAVTALLGDVSARARLKKAGQRQAARFDLGARAAELGALLAEATGVPFHAKLPPLDEVTQPAPIARAVPATPLATSSQPRRSPPPSLSEPSPKDTLTEDHAPPTVSPVPAAFDFADLGEGAAMESLLDGPTIEEGMLPRAAFVPRQPTPAPLPVALSVALPSSGTAASMQGVMPAPHDSGPKTGEPFVSRSAVKGLSAEGVIPGGDVWAGDTMLDPRAMAQPSAPAPERVKAAMLRTDSGSASVIRPVPTTAPETSSEARSARPPPGLGARSLQVPQTSGGADEWGPDTIADASPIAEPTRLPSQERGLVTHPPKGLLVEPGVGDMTAEDGELPADSRDAARRTGDVDLPSVEEADRADQTSSGTPRRRG